MAAGFGFCVSVFPDRMSCEWSCPGFVPADGAPEDGECGPRSEGPDAMPLSRCLQRVPA